MINQEEQRLVVYNRIPRHIIYIPVFAPLKFWFNKRPSSLMELNWNTYTIKDLSLNKFTYENKRTKKKELYWILEKILAFNKIEHLVILSKYM